jgi:hypothetical protein
MSNSSGPLPLKMLRLKPLREEEMMFPVGASTSGVRRLQRRRPPSPPSRRKTKRGLREEGIMRRKRKEKPILQVLLIASLAINTTLSFVILANRNRKVQATERKESVAPTVITLEDATVGSKVPTAANPVSQPAPLVAKKTVAPEATVRSKAPAKRETASSERDEISFFPTPSLYRLQRDTVLVTRRNGARILIPQGTLVRVAGITPDDKALVVSRKGNPDGLIARSSLEQIADEQVVPDSSASLQKSTVTAPRRAADTSRRFRLSGGPYGGSIGLGGAQIFVGQNGQISGSLSR